MQNQRLNLARQYAKSICLTVMLFAATVPEGTTQYALTPHGVQKGTGADVFGPGHRFHLEAPKGWTVDTQAGSADGLGAVFYPDGSSWQNAQSPMYTRVLDLDGKPFAQVVAGDLKAMSGNAPNFRATDKPSIVSSNHQTAIVKELSGEAGGQVERVAYFAEKHFVVMIILVSHATSDLQKSIPAFEQLVKSYRYISDGNAPAK